MLLEAVKALFICEPEIFVIIIIASFPNRLSL